MDFEMRKASSSVTGFVDAFGYIGAAVAGVGSGWVIDNIGWNAAFYLWIGGSIAAGFLMSLLWNYKPRKDC